MIPKRAIKSLLGRAAHARGTYRDAFQQRAFVPCFHAVSRGPTSSPLVCTEEEFDAYCRLFAKYYDVISLERLLDRLAAGADISGCVAITFDDGYLDNHELAAPILVEHGLTATFFVATDFIGSTHQAWWDTDHQIESRWMTWDHVRDLHTRGFDIGAHTRSHADLGAVPFDEAVAEIEGSVDDIARELGVAPTLFATPFGGQANMTPKLREYLRGSGLRCCPSAYGGLVAPDSDAFALNRVPITPWYRSVWQFAYEVAHLRDRDFVPHAARSAP